jgi:hypothetical protein
VAYEPYATLRDYNTYGYDVISDGKLEKRLKQASRHIDSLTFNRIIGKGFDNLTSFQQEIVKECTCELANFEYENEDVIQSVLQNYSINGVSMSFGSSWNVMVQNGVAIMRTTYAKLMQTGLCSLSLRW